MDIAWGVSVSKIKLWSKTKSVFVIFKKNWILNYVDKYDTVLQDSVTQKSTSIKLLFYAGLETLHSDSSI